MFLFGTFFVIGLFFLVMGFYLLYLGESTGDKAHTVSYYVWQSKISRIGWFVAMLGVILMMGSAVSVQFFIDDRTPTTPTPTPISITHANSTSVPTPTLVPLVIPIATPTPTQTPEPTVSTKALLDIATFPGFKDDSGEEVRYIVWEEGSKAHSISPEEIDYPYDLYVTITDDTNGNIQRISIYSSGETYVAFRTPTPPLAPPPEVYYVVRLGTFCWDGSGKKVNSVWGALECLLGRAPQKWEVEEILWDLRSHYGYENPEILPKNLIIEVPAYWVD